MNYASFFSYTILQIITPGPNNIMAMNNGIRHGVLKSFGFNLGVLTGQTINMLLASLFSSYLYKLVPQLKPYVTFIGAAYILYLAYKTFKSKPGNGSSGASIQRFLPGLAVQFINPKGVLMALTVASVYVTPNFDAFLPIMLLSLLVGFMCLASTVIWGSFGSLFQYFYSKNYKVINAVMAVLLVYCAASLFL
ncbi:MAG TPA: LysE family transporter [Bacillota bacterium]|nr:LysE family transporter [Bacillota bacterium]HOA15034.1 LysE family transporter [Bacillota bacterium]HOG53324.1 LysE family transporter [Bacillota bacterium]